MKAYLRCWDITLSGRLAPLLQSKSKKASRPESRDADTLSAALLHLGQATLTSMANDAEGNTLVYALCDFLMFLSFCVVWNAIGEGKPEGVDVERMSCSRPRGQRCPPPMLKQEPDHH